MRRASFEHARDVSREAVRAWERMRFVPRTRGKEVLGALFQLHDEPKLAPRRRTAPSAMDGADLRDRRRLLGLTQAELGRRVGVTQGTICGWERRKHPVTELMAEQVARAFLAAESERVTVDDVRAERGRVGWSQAELARRLGVSLSAVRSWETHGGTVPCRRWVAIRRLFAAAADAELGEPVPTLATRRGELRWSRAELARRLGVSQADVSRWERGAIVPPAVRATLERELASGLPPADPALARRDAVVDLVRDEPGISGKQVMGRMGGTWLDVRAAIERLRADGQLHERATRYVDSAGRSRSRPGLYPGPEPTSVTGEEAWAGQELVRRRGRLDWSQAELARRLGLAPAIVCRWEQAPAIPSEEMARLRAVLAAGGEMPAGGADRLHDLGAALAAARARLGLSVSAMARRLGVDRGTLAGWETGQRDVSVWRRREILTALDALDPSAD